MNLPATQQDLRNLSSWPQSTLIKRITEKLQNRFGELPTNGVLSGQAVASALMEVVGVGVGPMKDLDWFVDYNDEDVSYDGRLVRMSEIDFTLNRSSFSDGISLNATCKRAYRLVNSGMLPDTDINVIYCAKSEPRARVCARQVIQGFDLNCVEVGIDLDTKDLVWSESFQDFLYSKQIKVTRLLTPMHTALRLVKKQRALTFASVDLDTELKKLKMARYMGTLLEGEKQYLPSQLFSAETVQKNESILSFLQNDFKLEKVLVSIYNTTSAISEDHEFFKLIPLNLSECDAALCKNVLSHVGFTETVDVERYFPASVLLFSVLSKKSSMSAMKAYDELYGLIDQQESNTVLSKSFIDSFFNRFKIPDSCLHERYIMLMKFILQWKQSDASKLCRRDLKNIMRLCVKHINLFNDYIHLTLDSLAVIASNVYWLEKQKLQFVIGLFEQEGMEVLLASDASGEPVFFEPLDSRDFKSKAHACAEIYLNSVSKQEFPSVMKELDKYCLTYDEDIELVELTNQYDFLMQGIKEDHCVGGFYQICADYKAVVFAVRYKWTGDTATALYRLYTRCEDGVNCFVYLECEQFYGKSNTQVADCLRNKLVKKIELPYFGKLLSEEFEALKNRNEEIEAIRNRKLGECAALDFDIDLPF